MNSRDYKIFRPNHYYHIFNRGNNKQTIFRDSQDYLVFLDRFSRALGLSPLKSEHRVRIRPFTVDTFSIIAYVLMPNHYHFLIKQNSAVRIDQLVGKVCTSYAKYFNLKYGHIGNLFQDRFKAKLVDSDKYIVYLSAYIHNNPIQPESYLYSSYRDYLLGPRSKLVDIKFILDFFQGDKEKYRIFVNSFNQIQTDQIQSCLFEE